MSDKVTPITKHKDSKLAAGLAEAMGLAPKPYAGASQAIKDLLDHHQFDAAVIDKGWTEVRIVGNFTGAGAVIHTMQARQVTMSEREAPGIEILKMIATVNRLPNEAILSIATVEEIEGLNAALAGRTQDEILALAMQDEAGEQFLTEEVSNILDDIVDRFGPNALDGGVGPSPLDSVAPANDGVQS